MRLLIGALACCAKLMTLPSPACVLDGKTATRSFYLAAKQPHGRGVWDTVPQVPPGMFVMGASSEVPTALDCAVRA